MLHDQNAEHGSSIAIGVLLCAIRTSAEVSKNFQGANETEPATRTVLLHVANDRCLLHSVLQLERRLRAVYIGML